MSLSDKVLYADIVPDRLAYPRQAAFVRPFVWMRVHEDVDAAAEGEEGHVRGNAAAGESAKAATHSRHPPIDEGGPQEAEALAKKAWLIHRVIGAQAAQWERPPETAGHRPPEGARPSGLREAASLEGAMQVVPRALAERSHGAHAVWRSQGGVLFCAVCGAMTSSARLNLLAQASAWWRVGGAGPPRGRSPPGGEGLAVPPRLV